jgi:hypothetical protein
MAKANQASVKAFVTRRQEKKNMVERPMIGAFALAVALALGGADALAQDQAKYPDWKGQWIRDGGGPYDPSKPGGRGQQPPLTPEYHAVWESNIKSEASGSQEYNPQARCLPGGMPRMMIAYEPMEVVVTPEITYVIMEYLDPLRRIYTDGRDWPKVFDPTFAGYSIGKWEDTDGDGRYDTLLVETRHIRNPRIYEASGIPFHKTADTVVKEKLFLDKANRDSLINEITTLDGALTRPWTVTRKYRRQRNATWFEFSCGEANPQITLGGQSYFLTPDGELMPTRRNQPPPVIDLRHFEQQAK